MYSLVCVGVGVLVGVCVLMCVGGCAKEELDIQSSDEMALESDTHLPQLAALFPISAACRTMLTIER